MATEQIRNLSGLSRFFSIINILYEYLRFHIIGQKYSPAFHSLISNVRKLIAGNFFRLFLRSMI